MNKKFLLTLITLLPLFLLVVIAFLLFLLTKKSDVEAPAQVNSPTATIETVATTSTPVVAKELVATPSSSRTTEKTPTTNAAQAPVTQKFPLPSTPTPSPSQTPVADPAPTPPPSPPKIIPPQSTANLCEGLVTDKAAHKMSALSAPAKGQTVTDPEFGTTIRRITAVSPSEGENAIIVPMYGTIQAWNADESKLILYHRGSGHELYDGKTYTFIRKLNLESPTDLEHVVWDPQDPDTLYYPSNYNAKPRLMKYSVGANKNTVLKEFEFCPTDWGKLLSFGSDPMTMSLVNPDKIVGLQCGNTKFMYSIAKDTVLATKTMKTENAPMPGLAGEVAYLDGKIYDMNLSLVRTLALGNANEHASIGYSPASGHSVYAASAFDPAPGSTEAASVGSLTVHDMVTGAFKVIVGYATGYPYPKGTTHISAIAYKNPAWVAVSSVGNGDGQALLDGELLLANIDSGLVCRVAHHHSKARNGSWGYWAEPHVVISPSGTRLLFGSDWDGGDAVDSYMVELPSYVR